MTNMIPASDAAAYLKQTPHTLEKWRSVGRGPKYLKVGRSVYYRPEDLDEWLASRVTDPAAKSKRAA